MSVQLSDASVIANNSPIAIMPNSVTFTEGLGEQTIRAASIGGGQVEQIFSNNVESNFSMLKFDMPVTVENIDLVRQWKANRNQNLFQVAGKTVDGSMTRTFSQAAILNDYEVPLGSDTVISVEVTANPAI